MTAALRAHWQEYVFEAALLGLFMVSASVFGVVLDHPASPAYQAVGDPFVRRALAGTAMGLTAIGLFFSPWGKQSGAHINPAVTFTFYRLGKIRAWDAVFYIVAQFTGGAAGVLVAGLFLRDWLEHPSVNYVATLPWAGVAPAFAGEFFIAFVMMTMILHVTNTARLARYTGVFAGILIALYITLEAPFSGMSMNPARTVASALFAMRWDAVWIYFAAPLLAMSAAAELYVRTRSHASIRCAKLHHDNDKRCIHCGANISINHQL